MKNANFGFEPSVMDGSEWIFGAPTTKLDLPTDYSYRKYLPAVINQGELSICVPCSVSAYLNWKKNLENGERRDNKVAMMDIYGCKTNDTDGMTFKEAFHFLRHEGVRSNAGLLKINSYARIMNPLSLRYAIVMNGPCFAALPVYSDDCDFWVKKPGQTLLGYHAICIVGYNEKSFIIRNSWGASFCDDGYTEIPIEDISKMIEAWTIID